MLDIYFTKVDRINLTVRVLNQAYNWQERITHDCVIYQYKKSVHQIMNHGLN